MSYSVFLSVIQGRMRSDLLLFQFPSLCLVSLHFFNIHFLQTSKFNITKLVCQRLLWCFTYCTTSFAIASSITGLYWKQKAKLCMPQCMVFEQGWREREGERSKDLYPGRRSCTAPLIYSILKFPVSLLLVGIHISHCCQCLVAHSYLTAPKNWPWLTVVFSNPASYIDPSPWITQSQWEIVTET